MVRTLLVVLILLAPGFDLRAQDVIDQRVSILRAAALHAARVASDETGQRVTVFDVHPSSASAEDAPGLQVLAAELGRSAAKLDEIVTCDGVAACRSVDGSRAGFELSGVRLQGEEGSARLETWFLQGQPGSLSLRERVDQVHLVGSDGVWSVVDFRTLPPP